MSDRIELTQLWLGTRPYALVEAKLGPDGEDDLRLEISFGGGPQSTEEGSYLLAMALSELPGGMDLMRELVAAEDGDDA
jgi:hypothetical protein